MLITGECLGCGMTLFSVIVVAEGFVEAENCHFGDTLVFGGCTCRESN